MLFPTYIESVPEKTNPTEFCANRFITVSAPDMLHFDFKRTGPLFLRAQVLVFEPRKELLVETAVTVFTQSALAVGCAWAA